MRLRLFKDTQGEPRLYTFGFNESARKKPGAFPKHYRWFINWPGNSAGIEWVLFPGLRFGAGVRFDDTDEEDIHINFSIPFIITIYLSLTRCKWLLRLLGLTWQQVKDKPMRDWSRELGFSWHHGALWVKPWVNDDEWDRRHRHSFSINPADIILGRTKHRKYNERQSDGYVVMPEGYYPATVTLYTSEWKRPRWPFPKRIYRANVDIPDGVPVPGKGENSWDMDDDAILSSTLEAHSEGEALLKVYKSAMRSRTRYANAAWVPDGGWPAHLQRARAALLD